jgi:hypothetical protein
VVGIKETRAGTVWTKQLGVLTGADSKLLEEAAADSKDDDGTFKLALKYLMDTGRVDANKLEKETLMYGYVAALDLVNVEGYRHLAPLDDKLGEARAAVSTLHHLLLFCLRSVSTPKLHDRLDPLLLLPSADH